MYLWAGALKYGMVAKFKARILRFDIRFDWNFYLGH